MIWIAALTPSHADTFSWDWSQAHRYYLEARADTPWDARLGVPVRGYEVRLVTTCDEASRRVVRCAIEQAALSARATPEHETELPSLFGDAAASVGAVVHLRVRADVEIALVDFSRSAVPDSVRPAVERAFAGLDFETPRRDESSWVQYRSQLLAPSWPETAPGGVELVHRAIDRTGAYVQVQSAGRGVFTQDLQRRVVTALDSIAWFDVATGRMTDRTWTVRTGPDVVGGERPPQWDTFYEQGRVVALAEGEAWDIGPSEAWAACDDPPPRSPWGVGVPSYRSTTTVVPVGVSRPQLPAGVRDSF